MKQSLAGSVCVSLGWLLAAGTLAGGPSSAQAAAKAPPRDPGHARPSLIAESTGVVAGGTVNLAVHFDIDDPWYLYWKGQNDSGLPVSIEWILPEGSKVGELQWPAPQRVVLPGDIIDYIYKAKLTLIVPVDIPATATGTFTASARVDYLVCDQVCLPGSADLEIALPVKASPSENPPSVNAKTFEAARSTMPKPWSQLAGAITTWRGSTLIIKVPSAASLVFMPEEAFARLNDPITSGTAQADAISLTFAPPTSEAKPHVRGVLEVNRPGQIRPDYYLVDLPFPEIASPPTTTAKP